MMVNFSEVLENHSPFSTCDHRYTVFLSFRGIDTRNGFTDHLHKALEDASIQTFLDDRAIQSGEALKLELENAIKTSQVSIIVLSKNYASSTWCLDELVLILEQRRISKHTVIPIFYHIQPSDVRYQQRTFGVAIRTQKNMITKEMDPERKGQLVHKLELWTNALEEVSFLKGKNVNDRRETLVIEEIVKEISMEFDQHRKRKLLSWMRSPNGVITSFFKYGCLCVTQFALMCGAAFMTTLLADRPPANALPCVQEEDLQYNEYVIFAQTHDSRTKVGEDHPPGPTPTRISPVDCHLLAASAELIGAYLKVNRIEKAMETYELMKASGCIPDELTLTIMIRNLESAGRYKLAAIIKNDRVKYVDLQINFSGKLLENIRRD